MAFVFDTRCEARKPEAISSTQTKIRVTTQVDTVILSSNNITRSFKYEAISLKRKFTIL